MKRFLALLAVPTTFIILALTGQVSADGDHHPCKHKCGTTTVEDSVPDDTVPVTDETTTTVEETTTTTIAPTSTIGSIGQPAQVGIPPVSHTPLPSVVNDPAAPTMSAVVETTVEQALPRTGSQQNTQLILAGLAVAAGLALLLARRPARR